MKKRFAALLLAFLLTLLPVLSACSNSQVNTDANTGSQEKGDVTSAEGQQEEEAEPTATTIVKDRYADQNMQGYSYKILAIPTDGHFYTQVASGINEVYAEELNGEIEFWIDGEKYIFTKSVMIFLPAGMPHGPLFILKVDKPIFHYSVVTSREYSFEGK